MPVKPEVLSDKMFYAYAHPKQNRRFYLALVFSVLLFPAIAIALIAGTIFLIVPAFALIIWLGARTFFAYLVGNTILVSDTNFPRVNNIVEELKVKLGYEKRVYVFVYESSSFNAALSYLFFRRAVFLNSEILETGVSDDEVRWLVGRFIGYLRARRQAGVLGWVIRAAQYLVIFNFFLLPYERAMVFTGDRLAVAVIDGDISSAVSAIQKLFVGRQLGYSISPEGIIAQQRQIKGTFFAFLARIAKGFPHTTARYVDLMVFAKAFFPAQFANFETANPGLPADLPQLAAAHQPVPDLRPDGVAGMAKRPHGWVCAFATVAGVAGIGAISQTLTSSDVPAPPVAVPAIALAPGLPQHVHRDAQGQLAPDRGCNWLTNEPRDFRVVCR